MQLLHAVMTHDGEWSCHVLCQYEQGILFAASESTYVCELALECNGRDAILNVVDLLLVATSTAPLSHIYVCVGVWV